MTLLLIIIAWLTLHPPAWRIRGRRRVAKQRESGPLGLARMLTICLSAGLPLSTSLATIAEVGPPDLVGPCRSIVERSRHTGLARALLDVDGPLRPLCLRLAQAHISGAPLVTALSIGMEVERTATRLAAVARARRLPTLLLIPVALLLLPGFLLTVVAPPLLDEVVTWTAGTPIRP